MARPWGPRTVIGRRQRGDGVVGGEGRSKRGYDGDGDEVEIIGRSSLSNGVVVRSGIIALWCNVEWWVG